MICMIAVVLGLKMGALLDQAVLLGVTMYAESRCDVGAIGDNGRARGGFQLWHATGTLEGDARSALWIIRHGAGSCPDAPLAPYCGGCDVPEARRISETRVGLARDIVGDILSGRRVVR
jgi:hypothetical protein